MRTGKSGHWFRNEEKSPVYEFTPRKSAEPETQQGIKGFVIPTKTFVKIGITKIFCYNNKRFSSINKTFG